MNPKDLKVGTIFTPKSFEATKARLIAAEEMNKSNRGPINDNDIAYLNKVLDAPVDIFIKLV